MGKIEGKIALLQHDLFYMNIIFFSSCGVNCKDDIVKDGNDVHTGKSRTQVIVF